eukprot:3246177-Amphidinium_carterae.1
MNVCRGFLASLALVACWRLFDVRELRTSLHDGGQQLPGALYAQHRPQCSQLSLYNDSSMHGVSLGGSIYARLNDDLLHLTTPVAGLSTSGMCHVAPLVGEYLEPHGGCESYTVALCCPHGRCEYCQAPQCVPSSMCDPQSHRGKPCLLCSRAGTILAVRAHRLDKAKAILALATQGGEDGYWTHLWGMTLFTPHEAQLAAIN